MLIRKNALLLSLTLASFSVSVSAEPVVYVIAGVGQFGTMDLSTGSFAPIGPIPDSIEYLAYGPNGYLLT